MPEEDFQLIERPGGQLVKVYADGRKYLVSSDDVVQIKNEQQSSNMLQSEETLRTKLMNEVTGKKSALDNAGVPSEKRPI